MVEYEKRIYPERNLILISHITMKGRNHFLLFHHHCPLVVLKKKRRKKNNTTWFDDNCVLFYLLDSRSCFSSVSVVFDFNASLNDVTPVSPMMLPVDLIKMERVDCWWMSFVWCFFYAHRSDLAEWVLCFISMHHSMMLLLCLQSSYLLISWEKTDVLLLNTICVVSFVFTSQIEICKCCV